MNASIPQCCGFSDANLFGFTFLAVHATDTRAPKLEHWIQWTTFTVREAKRLMECANHFILAPLTFKTKSKSHRKLFSDFFGHKIVLFFSCPSVSSKSLRNSCSVGSFHSLVLRIIGIISIYRSVCVFAPSFRSILMEIISTLASFVRTVVWLL